MTAAEAGQASRNSTDSLTPGGTASRAIGVNPKRGNQPSAVVMHRPL